MATMVLLPAAPPNILGKFASSTMVPSSCVVLAKRILLRVASDRKGLTSAQIVPNTLVGEEMNRQREIERESVAGQEGGLHRRGGWPHLGAFQKTAVDTLSGK